jgi:hypothetical protein
MALSHVFSSPIADFTGTVTVFNSAGVTTTANATEIVRPSNWNSVHNEYYTLTGNTNSASTVSGTNVIFEGAGALTLTGSAGKIIFNSPAQSVQTQNMVSINGSTGAIVFSNSNNVSFGVNASTITATATFAQTNQSAIKALGVSNTGTTAGNTGVSTGVDWVLAGSGGITASQSTAGGGPNTIWMSVPVNAGTGTSVTGGASITLDTAGIKFNGTALAGTSSGSAGANVGISMTHNSAGLNLSITNPAQTEQTQSRFNLTLAGNSTSAGAGYILISSGVMTLAGGNNITLSQNGNAVTVSAGAGGGGIAASLSGNSTSGGAGYSNVSSGTLILAGGNNITLSQDGSRVTISGANVGGAQTGISGIGVSDTTYTSGTVIWSAQANVTLGSSVNGASQYVRISGNPAQTTQTQASGDIARSGFTTNATAGSVLVGTLNSGGLNVGVPAWITTYAAQTNQTLSMAATSNTAGNTSGLTVDARSLTLAGYGIASVGYSTSAGGSSIIVSASQTVQTQASGNIARTGFTTGATAGSVLVGTHDTAGLSLGVPAWITTYAQTNQSAIKALGVSNTGTTAGNTGVSTGVDWVFAGSGGITASQSTVGGGPNTIWMSVPVNAGTGTSVTGLASITLDTAGIKFNGTGLAGTGSTFAGNNITGAMTINSAGVNLALTGNAAGAGLGGAVASDTTYTSGTIYFSNVTNVTISRSVNGASQYIQFSGNPAQTNQTLSWAATGNTTAGTSGMSVDARSLTMQGLGAASVGYSTSAGGSSIVISAPATSSLAGVSGVSISTNGSTISHYDGVSQSHWRNMAPSGITTHAGLAITNGSLSKRPILFNADMEKHFPGVSSVRVILQRNVGTSLNMTCGVAFYSYGNATSLALVSSTTNAVSITTSSQWSGIRAFDITGLGALTLTRGEYIGALYFSGSNNSTAVMDFALLGGATFPALAGWILAGSNNTAATASTLQMIPMDGVYSNTTAAFPANIARSEIYGQGDATVNNVPFIQIIRNWT